MKSYYYYIILALSILLVVFILVQKDQGGGFSLGGDAFAVRDTSKVEMIIISKANKNDLVLNRQNGSWHINDSLPASEVAVNNFLFLMHRLRIRGIVEEELQSIEHDGVKIQIVEGRRRNIFRYYNFNGMDIIHKEGSSRLFSPEVSGFPDLRISQVANADPDFWRDRLIFSFKPEEIAVIEVSYPGQELKNFAIVRTSEGLRLFNPGNNSFITQDKVITENMNMFTSYFMDVWFDYVLTDRERTNEILKSEPAMNLYLKDMKGKDIHIEVRPYIKEGVRSETLVYLRKDKQQELLVAKQVLTDLWRKERKDFLFGE